MTVKAPCASNEGRRPAPQRPIVAHRGIATTAAEPALLQCKKFVDR
jgi:hypothetical protein